MRKGLQTFEPIELEEVKKTFDKTREIYNDITKEIVEYMKNYYEKIPQYSLEWISFSLNSNPPLMIRIKENLDNKEVKMNSGTLFDVDNKFTYLDQRLDIDTVRKMGIKIYEKTR